MSKELEKYRKYLIDKINSLESYNQYLTEHSQDLVLFLEVVDFKDETNLEKVRDIIEELNKLAESRASVMDKTITFLNESSKSITFKDVHGKTIFYNRILKIKNLEDSKNGSTEA